MTVGFRPEDLRIGGRPGAASVPARIDVCEPLGSHVLVHALVDTGSEPDASPSAVIVHAPPGTAFEAGAPIGLTVAPGKIFVFDAESGRAELSRDRVPTA